MGAKAENGASGNYDQSLASSLGYAYSSANGNLASKAGLNYTYGDVNHRHAVTALSNGNSYSYDSNGNMTQRVVGGQTYNLGYDAENHMVSVSGAAAAAYTYTGDGQRIVATEGMTTTVYLGNYLEWAKNTSTQAVTSKSYYYAGTTRVAMRQDGGAPLWLFGDHLGSTSVVANYDGSEHGKQGYQAWGETRFVSGDIPTSFQYTGQRNEANIGLYYYGARWYDSSLGRFAQPDSIIPGAYNPLSWDRFSYVNNNAIRYTDPTGHMLMEDGSMSDSKNVTVEKPDGTKSVLEPNGKVTITYPGPDGKTVVYQFKETYVDPASPDFDKLLGSFLKALPNLIENGRQLLTGAQKVGLAVTTILVIAICSLFELALIEASVDALLMGPPGWILELVLVPFDIALADFMLSFLFYVSEKFEVGSSAKFKWIIIPSLVSELPNSWQAEIHDLIPNVVP